MIVRTAPTIAARREDHLQHANWDSGLDASTDNPAGYSPEAERDTCGPLGSSGVAETDPGRDREGRHADDRRGEGRDKTGTGDPIDRESLDAHEPRNDERGAADPVDAADDPGDRADRHQTPRRDAPRPTASNCTERSSQPAASANRRIPTATRTTAAIQPNAASDANHVERNSAPITTPGALPKTKVTASPRSSRPVRR